MNKKDPVCHFEMPYEDKDRVAEFYNKAFGWDMHKLGKEMGDYIMAHTTETDENNMVKTPGNINGGFFAKTLEMPAQYPSVVIAVKDVKASAELVTQSGGKILGEPMEIPGIGMYLSFIDTEGNRVSMLQPIEL